MYSVWQAGRPPEKSGEEPKLCDDSGIVELVSERNGLLLEAATATCAFAFSIACSDELAAEAQGAEQPDGSPRLTYDAPDGGIWQVSAGGEASFTITRFDPDLNERSRQHLGFWGGETDNQASMPTEELMAALGAIASITPHTLTEEPYRL